MDTPPISWLTKIRQRLLLLFTKLYNACQVPQTPWAPCPHELPELNEIRQKASCPTDISDYLETLFLEAVSCEPQLMVELGVRGGESTFALERAARLSGASLVSVDLEPVLNLSTYEKWYFIQADDIEFGRQFQSWCQKKSLPAGINFLFIDTSHLFQHTLQEIQVWFPYLAPRAKVIFHDTNLKYLIFRQDGSLFIGWNNQRGVIRALENYFHTHFQEKHDFSLALPGWYIRHFALSSGLTILDKTAT